MTLGCSSRRRSLSAAQPRSSLVVRQRAAGSVDHATSRVSFATSMPTPQEPGIGSPFPDRSTGHAQPCECEVTFQSTVRALPVDQRPWRPSYTTEWNHGSRGLPRPRSNADKDTRRVRGAKPLGLDGDFHDAHRLFHGDEQIVGVFDARAGTDRRDGTDVRAARAMTSLDLVVRGEAATSAIP